MEIQFKNTDSDYLREMIGLSQLQWDKKWRDIAIDIAKSFTGKDSYSDSAIIEIIAKHCINAEEALIFTWVAAENRVILEDVMELYDMGINVQEIFSAGLNFKHGT